MQTPQIITQILAPNQAAKPFNSTSETSSNSSFNSVLKNEMSQQKNISSQDNKQNTTTSTTGNVTASNAPPPPKTQTDGKSQSQDDTDTENRADEKKADSADSNDALAYVGSFISLQPQLNSQANTKLAEDGKFDSDSTSRVGMRGKGAGTSDASDSIGISSANLITANGEASDLGADTLNTVTAANENAVADSSLQTAMAKANDTANAEAVLSNALQVDSKGKNLKRQASLATEGSGKPDAGKNQKTKSSDQQSLDMQLALSQSPALARQDDKVTQSGIDNARFTLASTRTGTGTSTINGDLSQSSDAKLKSNADQDPELSVSAQLGQAAGGSTEKASRRTNNDINESAVNSEKSATTISKESNSLASNKELLNSKSNPSTGREAFALHAENAQSKTTGSESITANSFTIANSAIEAAPKAGVSDHLAPRLGTKDWNQALSQKIVWMVGGGEQTAELTLNPPDLGPMQVVLSVNDNQVDASFVSAHLEVREAIEAAAPRLREMMDNAGMSLSNFSVSAQTSQTGSQFGSGGAFDQAQQQQSARFAGTIMNTREPLTRTETIQTIRPTAQNRGGVDTFV